MVRNILIIDSNISFAVSIKRALEETGKYAVRNVTRLRPAVDALEQMPYDAAVVDTNLEFSTVGEVVVALRNFQAQLPIILSSPYEEDSKLVPQVGAQGFMSKPYVARMLIRVLEDAIARGYSPFDVETQPNLAQKLEDQDRQEILEPMLEASRHNASTMMEEPPTTADDSTIGEVIDQALRPEVSQKIYATIDPTPLPDDATEVLQERQPIKPPDEEDSQPTPAEAALSATLGTTSLDALLEEIRNYARGHLFKPIDPPETPNTVSEVIAATPPPPKSRTITTPIFPPPVNDDTRLDNIPPPPRLPDQDWLDQQPEQTKPEPFVQPQTEPQQDTQPEPVLYQEPEPEAQAQPSIIDEELVPVTLEEISRQMTAVFLQELEAEELEKEAATLTLDSGVLAHYALQLTSFAMESSALGAVLTQGSERVAQAGDLTDAAWDEIVRLITENWNLPGDSRTRVLYRNLGFGDILIYSIQTRSEQILTLIFDAEMPLKVIRRQAGRLSESLQHVPESPIEEILRTPPPNLPEFHTVEQTPVGVAVRDVEPQDQESVPPDQERESQTPIPYEPHHEGTRDIAIQTSAESAQEAAAPPQPKPARPAGSYTSYGCVWLVENPRDAISPSAADMVLAWVRDICAEKDWDLADSHIESEWLYVAVEVPNSTLPNVIAETLMNGTAERALSLDPSRTHQNPWGMGYLIRTPANSLTTEDIDRFIRFYRSNQI